jgi:hypothetical protein
MATTLNSTGVLFPDSSQQTTAARGGGTVTTTSSDLTLTSTSSAIQRVTFTAPNKRVILPNATTMGLGPDQFQIDIGNNGTPSFRGSIATSTGLVVAGSSISPVAGAGPSSTRLSLSNNNADQSGWGYTHGYNSTSDIQIPPPSGLSSWSNAVSGVVYVNLTKLSATTFLLSYVLAYAQSYACVGSYSGNTWTWGTPVLVRNDGGAYAAIAPIALSATTGFYFTGNYYFPFSISGLTISFGSLYNPGAIGTPVARNSTSVIVTNGSQQTRVVNYNGLSAPTQGTIFNLATYANGLGIANIVYNTYPVNVSGNIWAYVFGQGQYGQPTGPSWLLLVDWTSTTASPGTPYQLTSEVHAYDYQAYTVGTYVVPNSAGTEISVSYTDGRGGSGQQQILCTVSGTSVTSSTNSSYYDFSYGYNVTNTVRVTTDDFLGPYIRYKYVTGTGLVPYGPVGSYPINMYYYPSNGTTFGTLFGQLGGQPPAGIGGSPGIGYTVASNIYQISSTQVAYFGVSGCSQYALMTFFSTIG